MFNEGVILKRVLLIDVNMDTSEHNDQVVFDSQSMDENNDLGGFGDLLDKV